MNVRVFFDPIFSRLTGTEGAELVVDPPDLSGLIVALTDRYGEEFRKALVDTQGGMVPGVVVLADGVCLSLGSPLPQGVEVAFLTAIAGG